MSPITEFLDIYNVAFYISLLGIVGMISMKAYEIRSGKKSIISKVSEKTNHTVHNFFNATKKFLSYLNRKTALALMQWIAYHILSRVRKTYIRLRELAHMHPPSKKVLDMVRGKGDANKNGGSSIYLKMISENGEEIVDKKPIL